MPIIKKKKQLKKTLQPECCMTEDHPGKNSLTSRIETCRSRQWKITTNYGNASCPNPVDLITWWRLTLCSQNILIHIICDQIERQTIILYYYSIDLVNRLTDIVTEQCKKILLPMTSVIIVFEWWPNNPYLFCWLKWFAEFKYFWEFSKSYKTMKGFQINSNWNRTPHQFHSQRIIDLQV